MSSPPPISVTIIGCGAVVEELHAPALRQLERAHALKVSTLVDPSPERTARLRRLFPGAAVAAEPAATSTDVPMAATLVASPPPLHRQHVAAALAAGNHVLCEKPLGPTVADTEAIAALASQARRLVMVGMTRRFQPALATAAGWVRCNQSGEGVEFIWREGGVYTWPIRTDAPFRRRTGGGGVLLDKGVHVLDALLWLFGPLQVEAAWDDAWQGGVEGNCGLKLRAEGVRGDVQLSWDQPLKSGLWIRHAGSELWVDFAESRFVRTRTNGGPWERNPCTFQFPASVAAKDATRVAPADYEEGIRLQWVGFLRAMLHGEPVPVDPAGALLVARQIESAYRIMEPLPPPWLSPVARAENVRRHWKGGVQ